ncbi:hypothetical protein MNBD_GAMMA21-2860 [hydrothermal vent metagenome]|uniref:Uncharacterized protein n=1 Tax=hydrothermal vent metagenome TaxID=652676 RepID=A0A3B1B204_9ZZZZ
MPYFIFRINQGPAAIVKNLELINTFEVYKEAKSLIKSMRAEQVEDDNTELKIIFSDNQLLAEEELLKTREESITREWEK